jgi:hypothetical protein
MNDTPNIKLSPIEHAIIGFTNALYDPACMASVSKEEMRDALSSGQLMSKQWLLDKIVDILPLDGPTKVLVAGGWIGLLARAINECDTRFMADSLDINEKSTMVAHQVLAGTGTAIHSDMYDFDYTGYACVVNTSSEHIPNIASWLDLIDVGTMLVVQSNNARHVPDHVNCVDSVTELERSLNLSETLFAGELIFPMYTRYMVIGRR